MPGFQVTCCKHLFKINKCIQSKLVQTLNFYVLPPFGNDNPNGSKLSKLALIKNLKSHNLNSRNLQSMHILSIFMGPSHPFQKSISKKVPKSKLDKVGQKC